MASTRDFEVHLGQASAEVECIYFNRRRHVDVENHHFSPLCLNTSLKPSFWAEVDVPKAHSLALTRISVACYAAKITQKAQRLNSEQVLAHPFSKRNAV